MIERIVDTLTVATRSQASSDALARFARVEPLSPWAISRRDHLSHVAFDLDMIRPGAQGPVTFAEAMRVPAIKKGRALLHSVLCSTPLVAIRNVNGVDTTLTGDQAPTWLYRSDTGISPETRMAGILDDHLFHEATVLYTERGAIPKDQTRGPILDAIHVPYDWWDLEDDGTFVWIDGDTRKPAAPDEFLWIPGPSNGLLVEAADEIRQWRNITRNIDMRLSAPAPSLVLSDSEDGDVDDEEVDKMVAAVAAQRRSPDGGVMYVPNGITATALTNNDDAQLYIEARNALRIDIANHLNLPVALMDGSPATASLTYSTNEGKRSEFDDLSMGYWTNPLHGGLSQDVVVPRGTRVRFDFASRYASTNAPTGAPTQD